jgi:Dihydroorotase and related cyclic amidohydrolases
MLKSFNTKVHFTKISSAAALNKIRKSKIKMISADTASHYLCFSDHEIQQNCSEFKDFPPIRSNYNNQLLWDIIKLHGFYSVASHHASIPTSLKHLNGGSFSESLSGINSLGFVLQAI